MPTHRALRPLRLAALAVVLASPSARAQLPVDAAAWHERPRWVARPLPANFTGPSSVRSLGTSVVMQTPTHVHLWSAITLRWVDVPVSPGAVVTQFNAYVTIEDGNTVHAFATRIGAVESLTFPAPPQLHYGSPSSNWLSIAVSGTDAWAFGAFDGHWRHHTLQGASPTVTISQTTGLLEDGADRYGVSAYHGDFVLAPALTGATSSVVGDVAIAWSPTAAVGFSAHTGQWASAAFGNAALLGVDRGYAMFHDAGALVAYSPCTGSFASHTVPALFAFTPGRYLAAAIAGNDVLAYSSGRNEFDQHTFASAPALSMDDEVLAVLDAQGATAFSVVTGAFSSTVPGATNVLTNDALVWADDGVQGHAYAAVTGAWSPAPLPVGGAVQLILQRDVAVQADAQGYHAFSGRTGAWVGQPVGNPLTFTGPATSDLFLAFDGPSSYAFDPVLVRWAHVQTGTPVTAHDVWRQAAVAVAGSTAYGFGLMNNVWSSIPLGGNFLALDANSSCGHVVTDTHVYAFSAHGSLSTLSRFPEFSRLQPLGAPLRLVQAAPPGSQVVALLAHQGTYQPLLLGGTLFVDPGSIFRRQPLGTVPASGVLDVALDLSGVPALQGTAIHVQTLITPRAGGPAWLANSIAPVGL